MTLTFLRFLTVAILVGAVASAQTIAPTISCPPDLSANQIIAPSSANAGGTMNITYSVTNIGCPPNPALTYDIYFSANQTITASDYYVATVTNGTLGVNQAATITIPSSIPTGTYYTGIVVYAAPNESFTSNNIGVSTATINLLPPVPDLVASSITGPVAAIRNQSISVTRNITNVGGPITASFVAYDVLLSANQTYEQANDPIIGQFNTTTLGSVAVSCTIPSNMAAGSYYILLRVYATASEAVTTNNVVASAATIGIVVAAPTITSLTPNTGPAAGGTLVTINGTNFVGTPAVSFNGAAATNVTFVSTIRLTCTTPAIPIGSSINATATVTTSQGTGSLTNAFNYGDPQPGSGEDFILLTGVNAAANNSPIKQATAGNVLAVAFSSPNGTFVGTAPVLVAQIFNNGTPPLGIGAYPSIHVDPLLCFVVFNGAQMPGGFVYPLPTGTTQFLYSVPAGLVGKTLRLQALALSSTAANGFFAATSAHDVIFF